jgi:ribosomal-protein-alanine N-acetyltransferase
MVLEVAEGNAAARALYAAGAFRPVGRRSRYYPDGGDALVLRRELA